jgi:hypothetical protein
MATTKRITKIDGQARLYGAFIKRLIVTGAVQCPKCRDYVYMDRHACSGVSSMFARPQDCHSLPLAA